MNFNIINVIRTKLDNISNPKYLINNAIGKIDTTWDCNYLLNVNNTYETNALNVIEKDNIEYVLVATRVDNEEVEKTILDKDINNH